jgi:hypothetical protein
MVTESSKYIPFMQWIIEVAEEKILEHKVLKDIFDSHEEFIVFTIIWMRVYKNVFQTVKEDNSNNTLDTIITNFYKNQKKAFLGMTINGLTRESLIPRSTVKRIVEKLIKKDLVSKNSNRLIIPTAKVRDTMRLYRQFNYRSYNKLFNIFTDLKLKNMYNNDDNF